VASRDTLGATFGPPWSRHTGRIHVLEAGPFVLPERVKPADAWAQPTFADNHCRATKRGPIWPGQTSR